MSVLLLIDSYEKALENYNKALDICKQTNSAQAAKVLINIGRIHFSQGLHEQAFSELKQALDTLPVHHADFVESLVSLTHAYRKLGFQQEAMASINEAYYKCRKLAKVMPNRKKSLSVATLLIGIGMEYNEQNVLSKSLECLKEALETNERCLPALHFNIFKILGCIGYVYQKHGQFDQAFDYYEKALHMGERILPFEHQEIPVLIINIACLYKMKGMLNQAEKCLDEALSICRRHSYNKLLVDALTHYGDIWERQGLYYVAMANFKEALQIERQTTPLNRGKIIRILKYIEHLYMKQNRMEEALDTNMEVFNIQRSTQPHDHPQIAQFLTNFGIAYEQIGQYEKALKFYYEGLEMRQRILHDGHPDIQKSWKLISALVSKESD